MKKIVLLFLLFIFNTGMAYPDSCLSVYGLVADAATSQPVLNATIMVRVQNGLKTIGNSGSGGQFVVEIPCNSGAIVVEANGYRALTVPVTFERETAGKSFYVLLPMTASDKQAVNRPYLQSEQKQYVLQTERATASSLIRSFHIVDALTGKAVDASLCLQYTRTGHRNCQPVKARQGNYRVSFKEPDIVALEVKSSGYQSYQGNLIIDKLDGSDQVYEIKLSRELTLLSVFVDNAKQAYQIRMKSDQRTGYPLQFIDNQHYYAQSPQTGLAMMQVLDGLGQVVAEQKVIFRPGMSYYVVQLSSPTRKPAEVSQKTVALLPVESIPDSCVLLFDQSDYVLKTDNKTKLDLLSAWLRRNEAYRLFITGHSDNVGDPLKNQTLSEFRARVVFRYLLNAGVHEQQMSWKAAGSNLPALPNDNEQNRVQNRRVVVNVIH